jgi:hypothetical protein
MKVFLESDVCVFLSGVSTRGSVPRSPSNVSTLLLLFSITLGLVITCLIRSFGLLFRGVSWPLGVSWLLLGNCGRLKGVALLRLGVASLDD